MSPPPPETKPFFPLAPCSLGSTALPAALPAMRSREFRGAAQHSRSFGGQTKLGGLRAIVIAAATNGTERAEHCSHSLAHRT